MRNPTFIALLLVVLCHTSLAQHCPGITESYLSALAVKHVDKDLKIRGEYSKMGKPMERYQMYLLVYLDGEADKISILVPEKMMGPQRLRLNPDHMLILRTQLMERNKEDGYPFEYQIDVTELTKTLMKKWPAAKNDGQPEYEKTFRMAVFVPFLEDETYSNLADLPEDKHECNYRGAPALLLQQLPYRFRFKYYDRGEGFVDINSDQFAPAKPK